MEFHFIVESLSFKAHRGGIDLYQPKCKSISLSTVDTYIHTYIHTLTATLTFIEDQSVCLNVLPRALDEGYGMYVNTCMHEGMVSHMI